MSKIINFHDVHDINWFDNTICLLKKKYKIVDLDELLNLYSKKSELKNVCHITVDDGDKTFYSVIFPIIKKHKIPLSIFVSPDAAINQQNFWFQEIRGYNKHQMIKLISEIIKTEAGLIEKFRTSEILKCLKIDVIWEIINQYKTRFKPDRKLCQNMNVSELKEVFNSGLVTIGAHTMKHPILANEGDYFSRNEISKSINELSDLLDRKVTCFAYPNGVPGIDFGQREMDLLKASDCLISFSTEANNFNLSSNLLSIPRYGFSLGSMAFLRTKLFLGPYWETIKEFRSKSEVANRKEIIQLIR